MKRTAAEVREEHGTARQGGHATFREASFSDHARIARLEVRHGLVAKTAEEWRHLWLGNPLYRQLGGDWPLGWVLEDGSGQIVGSIANIPLSYELEGASLLVASGHNWVADPPYRGMALALLDRVINQPGVDLYVNNTNSASSTAVVESLGCERVPVGRWDRSALWVTHHQAFFESRLARRRWLFATPLSHALGALAALRERVSTRPLRHDDVEVRVCADFGEWFDEFWRDFRARHRHRLLAVRTRETLAWHHRFALMSGTLWIVAAVDGSRLLGYATFQRVDRPALGRRVRLVDFQSIDGSATLFRPLLAWAVARCRDERIHTLEIVGGGPGNGELLDGIAPHWEILPTWKYVYRASHPWLASQLRDPAAWAPSLFDGDASL